MGDLSKLQEQAAELESQLQDMAFRTQMLKQTLRDVRAGIAKLKKAKKKKPENTAVVQLRAAQSQIRATRVAAAKALRARGCTISDVERILGVSYAVIKSAEDRVEREAIG